MRVQIRDRMEIWRSRFLLISKESACVRRIRWISKSAVAQERELLEVKMQLAAATISKTRLANKELLTLRGKLAGGSKLGFEVVKSLEEAASSGVQSKSPSTNEHVMLRWLEARGFYSGTRQVGARTGCSKNVTLQACLQGVSTSIPHIWSHRRAALPVCVLKTSRFMEVKTQARRHNTSPDSGDALEYEHELLLRRPVGPVTCDLLQCHSPNSRAPGRVGLGVLVRRFPVSLSRSRAIIPCESSWLLI